MFPFKRSPGVEEGFDRSRRDAAKKMLAGAVGFAGLGALPREALADNKKGFSLPEEAPKKFNRNSLPMPDFDFEKLGKKEKIDLGKRLLKVALTGVEANIEKFDALDENEQVNSAKYVEVRHRLVIRFVRHTLMQWKDKLNAAQKKDLGRFNTELGNDDITLGDLDDLEKAVSNKSKALLYDLYRKVTLVYQQKTATQNIVKKENEQDSKDQSAEGGQKVKKEEPAAEGSKKDSKRKKDKLTTDNELEGQEVKGKEGVYYDKYGKKFGFGYMEMYYDPAKVKEIKHADLVEFDGTSISGKNIKLKLRKEAHDAWMKMVAEKSGGTICATEGFRTFEYQKKMRRKYGIGAALPGKSEHHLGTTVDILDANHKIIYDILMNYQDRVKGDKSLPLIIKHGFVPTVKKEVWHFRHVGEKAAKIYWKKHASEIIDLHSRRLRE